MNLRELKEIIQQVVEHDISEFEYERAGTRVRIKRGAVETPVVSSVLAPAGTIGQTQIQPQPSGTAAAAAHSAESTPGEKKEDLHAIRSPIVGTFYRSPNPGAPAFVKVGDEVEIGMVLCIIEAMKLMNEIESDVSGEVVKILVENNQPVEYGQELFLIRSR